MFHMSLHKTHILLCTHQWDHCNHLVMELGQELGLCIFHHNSDNKLYRLHLGLLGTAQCMHRVILLGILLVKVLALALAQEQVLA